MAHAMPGFLNTLSPDQLVMKLAQRGKTTTIRCYSDERPLDSSLLGD